MSTLIGDFPFVSSTKSNQALKCLSTQDLKDSGRVQMTWYYNQSSLSSTTEIVLNPTVASVGFVSNTAFSWPYTVTAGKILRLQWFYLSVTQPSGTAAVNNAFLRVRVAKPGVPFGTSNTTNAVVAMLDVSQPSATDLTIGSSSLFFQDGIEIPGGYQVGVTAFTGAVNITINVDYILAGYEY